jgi:hypothetical protein
MTVMVANDHRDFEDYDDIQHLLASGTLKKDSDAYDIARLTIQLGFGALSKKQRYIYAQVITPALEELAREQGAGAPD